MYDPAVSATGDRTAAVAVILAGGLGTRLRSVVSDRPKPLAEVDGRPFIERILLQVRDGGIRDVVLCVGYQATLVQEALGTGTNMGLRIRYSVEDEPMGTAGAIKLAEPLLGDSTLLVMNGDSFLDMDLRDLIAFHRTTTGAASMALTLTATPERFGSVELDARGQVVAFREKATGNGSVAPGTARTLINAGIYLFQPVVLRQIPPNQKVSLESDVFPGLIEAGIFARAYDTFFVDIGLPATYEALRSQPFPRSTKAS